METFIQAEKLSALGTPAGGVAHARVGTSNAFYHYICAPAKETAMGEKGQEYVFRLYTSDRLEQMQAFVDDLREVVEKHFPGCCRIELIDVLSDPEQAAEDRVFVTPTLLKAQPEPVQRVIGDLSEPEEVLAVLGILSREPKRPAPPGDHANPS